MPRLVLAKGGREGGLGGEGKGMRGWCNATKVGTGRGREGRGRA